MARKNRLFAKLASDVDTSGNLAASGIQSAALDTGVTVYATRASLPTSGNTAGDQAYVTGNNRLYIWNGSGWYNIALLNVAPSIQSVLDSGGGTTPFSLAIDGTATTITITAADSDGDPITYSATSDSGFSGLATLSQADNVFTITPFSQDSATTSSGTITFTATDGINVASSGIQTFTLSFLSALWDETVLSIGTSSTNSLANSTFIDRSTNAHTVTVTGTPVQTAFHPYLDNWSSYISSETGALCYQDDDLRIGTGDFTAEGWFWISADTIATGTYHALFDTSKSTTYGYENTTHTTHIGFWLRNDYALRIYSGGSAALGTTSNTLNVNEWNHCALVRSGTTVTMYINGVSGGTFSSSANYNLNSVAFGVAPRWTTSYTAGPMYVGNFRLEVGNARYTANFTPPTTAFESTADTVFLKNYNNHQALIGGVKTNSVHSTDVEVSAFNPFGQESEYAVGENKGSVYLNGSSYMTLATSPFHMDQSDYTVECWIYPTVLGRYIMGIWSSTSASNQAWSLRTFSGGNINSEIDPGDVQIATSSAGIIKLNQWHHVALTRSGGDFRIFVDGDVVASGSSPGFNMAEGGGFMGIGAVQGLTGSPFTGYISDIYIRKGAAKYTSAFTIPTAPVQNTDATLYLPMDNAGIYDKTGNHTIALGGNTSTSTTQTKFATTSMYFDGTGDYARFTGMPSFGTNSFTVEGWIYNSSAGGVSRNIADARTGSSWTIQAASNEYKVYDEVAASYIHTTTGSFETNNLNSWIHIAWCRSGSTSRFFINGTQVGSDVSNSSNYQNTSLRIGSRYSEDQQYFNGYIENFQILNGVAKYTANFTPPTQTQSRTYQAES